MYCHDRLLHFLLTLIRKWTGRQFLSLLVTSGLNCQLIRAPKKQLVQRVHKKESKEMSGSLVAREPPRSLTETNAEVFPVWSAT